jgi:hypothetical protein
MALVLLDVGADQILKAYFNNNWPASKNLQLKLFVNDVTPAQTGITYTEAAGGGYASIALTNGSWVVTTGNDPSDAVYAQQTFTFTGALTTNPTVYGYYIEDNAGSGVIIYAERLGASFTPVQNGDNLKITPKFQLSSGTPA